MSKWYSIIVGVVLALVGLDPWLPTGPEVMVMPLAGGIAIVVGIVGIALGVMDLKGKKKEGAAPTPPSMPAAPSQGGPASPAQ